MTTISLKIPDSLLIHLGGTKESLTQESQYLLAVKLFEIGRISSGQAADMCGMNRIDFLLKLGKSGISVADLEGEELDREIQNA